MAQDRSTQRTEPQAGRWLRWTTGLALTLALALGACGGGDGGPDSASPGAGTLDATGGTLTLGGVQVIVPADALAAATTVRVAADSVGAPPPPAGARLLSPIYSVTPHGVDFARPARLRIPFDASGIAAGARPVLLKAQPGSDWVIQSDTERDGDALLVDATTFSFYAVTLCRPVEVYTTSSLVYTIGSCWTETSEVTLQAVAPMVNKSGPKGTQPAGVDATITQPQYVELELRYTVPAVEHGLDFSLVRTGNRTLPVELLSGPLPPSPARLRIPVTEALNGTVSLQLQITCRSQPYVWQPSLGNFCASGDEPRPTPDPAARPALKPFRAVSNLVVLAVNIAPGTPVGDLAPLISVQPSSQTVAEGMPVPLFRVETPSPSTRHAWEASFDGGQSWVDLGSFPVRFSDPPGAPLCFLNDPPCERLRLPADPALVSEVAAPCGRTTNTDCTANLSTTLRMNGRKLRARLTNDFGTTVSNVATLSVVAAVPPAITQPPQSQQIAEGQTASFTVVAGGLPGPEICWQSRASDTQPWADVGFNCPGRGTYTTSALSVAASGTQYRAVARSSAGSVPSEPATVTVTRSPAPPSISSQPAALTVTAGSTAVFAAAINGTAPLSYQWFRNGVAMAGANAPVLQLPAVDVGDSGSRYELEIGNGAGSVRSASATLTVTPGGTPPPAQPPVIDTAPRDVTVHVGDAATFAVAAGGTGPFTYQWRRNGTRIDGAVEAAFTIASVAAGDAGAYSVIVSNAAGSVTSSAGTLSVLPLDTTTPTAPAIQTPPATLVALPGSTATLAVAASGSAPLSYAWARNGTTLPGATGPVLTLAAVSGADAGSYTVTVRNAAGSVTSAAAQLIVVGAPAIVVAPSAQAATEGGVASFSVTASGDGLRYQWTRDNVAISGATAAGYTTPALTLADNGARYGVIVYNGAGVAISSGALLTVTAATTLTQTQQASVTDAGAMPSGISYRPSVSADGSRVAFISNGNNLIPGTINQGHAYLRDRVNNTTTRITVRPDGSESSQGTSMVKLAANGRYVVFRSRANDLVAGDTNTADDVFVRDLQTQTTVRVNVLADGSQDTVSAGTTGLGADISADGRKVLMRSAANLAGDGAATAGYRWYLRDLDAGVTRLVAGSEDGQGAALSPDGRYVAFITVTSSPAQNRLMLYDDQGGSTSQLLAVPSGTFPEGLGGGLAVSDGAGAIAFWLRSSSVGGGAAAQYSQIGVFERSSGSVSIASVTAGGVAGDGHSSDPSLSRDGRYVSFRSAAPNLSGDPASAVGSYLIVRDRQAGTTRIASRRADGTPFLSQQGFNENALSADGSAVVHLADAGEAVPGALGGIQVFLSPRP